MGLFPGKNYIDQSIASGWNQFLLIVLLLMILSVQGVEAQSDGLVLSGSTTVQKRVIEPAIQLIEKQLGVRLTVRGVGSGVGIRALMAGKVDIAMASSGLDDLMLKNGFGGDVGLQAHLLHTDTIVPIVHRSNPVQSLSWKQLADIHTGKIRNWKELGGESRPIVVVTSHPDSATRSVFRKEVMKGASYVRSARQVKTTRRTVNLVGRHKGGIGVVSTTFIKQARHPERVSVVNSDRIARPLILITKSNLSATVQQLVDLLQSDQVKGLIQ